MKKISVLDVTLRDGGCVNNFKFGQEYMNQILYGLEESGVDYIELGYIDQENGSEKETTKFCNEKVIEDNFLKTKKPGIKYVAMIDYGRFDIENLKQCDGNGIDGIRLAFHKANCFDIINLGRAIIEKGYELFIQPMITMRYSDTELLKLIDSVNRQLSDASGFYIVDSFGEMRSNDINRILHLVDHNLTPSMPIGFHSHNNIQLSYSNAMALLDYSTCRKIIIDSSIMGMGKGAGNLNTELLIEHLNLYYEKEYDISPLLKLMDRVISVIHKEFFWGYAAEYYLSSVNHCTPSYANYFHSKHMLSINEIANLLQKINEEKKISFDQNYAEKLYIKYNEERDYNDEDSLKILENEFRDKNILLIAPGKSIIKAEKTIEKINIRSDVISISLNNEKYNTDYIFITRKERYFEAINNGKKIITPSNVTRETGNTVYVIDYKKWIIGKNGTKDASGILILNLLEKLGTKKIYLAGFDGFSGDVNDNYYDKSMRIPISSTEAEERNIFYREYISKLREKIEIEFLTPSQYMR